MEAAERNLPECQSQEHQEDESMENKLIYIVSVVYCFVIAIGIY